MASFSYNGYEVYNAKDVKEKYHKFFCGCTDNTKSVVEMRQIPPDAVFYATKTQTGWNPSTRDVRKSALLLDKTWVDENVPKFLGTLKPTSLVKKRVPDCSRCS